MKMSEDLLVKALWAVILLWNHVILIILLVTETFMIDKI